MDNPPGPEPKKQWVQFPEDQEAHHENAETIGPPAVIEPSVQILPNQQHNHPLQNQNQSPIPSNNNKNHYTSSPNDRDSSFVNISNLQNVELRNSETNVSGGANGSSSIGRRNNGGFTNGDVIVSVLPTNSAWPWITPASFRPELVPEELMVPGLTLTVEEYVHAMELLTSDLRFNAYTICYKRLLASWLVAAFLILLIILFSGVVGIGLFALGISWLIINAAAVFLCMYIKIKINQGLEKCMARVNKLLIKHKLIVGLDDRGRISCHKVHLCFIYFDPTDCIKRLEQVLDGVEDRQRVQRHLDASDVEIVITGAQNTTRIPQRQSEALLLKYLQRWAKDYFRELATSADTRPLHCPKQQCPCQYTEDIVRGNKQRVLPKLCLAMIEATPVGETT